MLKVVPAVAANGTLGVAVLMNEIAMRSASVLRSTIGWAIVPKSQIIGAIVDEAAGVVNVICRTSMFPMSVPRASNVPPVTAIGEATLAMFCASNGTAVMEAVTPAVYVVRVDRLIIPTA